MSQDKYWGREYEGSAETGRAAWAEKSPERNMGSGDLFDHFTFLHWRRKWQPTPVFLPGESQGWGSLEGCRLWGYTESETTEAT